MAGAQLLSFPRLPLLLPPAAPGGGRGGSWPEGVLQASVQTPTPTALVLGAAPRSGSAAQIGGPGPAALLPRLPRLAPLAGEG